MAGFAQGRIPVRGAWLCRQVHAHRARWLRAIRREVGDRVHFWPFDGWNVPDDRSVIAEFHPKHVGDANPRDDRTNQHHDTYPFARWLFESDPRGLLGRYARPTLTDEERRIADVEGWILGVT